LLEPFEALRADLERKFIAMYEALPPGEPATSRDEFLECYVPPRGGATEPQLQELEDALGCVLPTQLRKVIASYELGSIELAGIHFGGAPTFRDFVKEQHLSPTNFWGAYRASEAAIGVASSPGHILCVTLSNGFVSQLPIGVEGAKPRRVALDFDLLLRGLATLATTESVQDAKDFARKLAEDVGAPESEDFWFSVIVGGV
jgi:hypothetical protein